LLNDDDFDGTVEKIEEFEGGKLGERRARPASAVTSTSLNITTAPAS
jgi:hypothetical protein